jgi:site-specific DNA recombinase
MMLEIQPTTKQKTALGYLRVSDKKQLKGESLANQKASIKEYAQRNNVKVVEWFVDKAKSGKNTERDGLHDLLATALKMKNKPNFIIVYKMSRASRDVETYMTNIRAVLASKGIAVRSATETFDDSPMGKFIETLYVSVAQLDNDTKTEMVVDNMTRIAKQGFWQHGPPKGYDKCKINNSEGKPRPSLKPNNEAEAVIKVLMRWNRGNIIMAELCRYGASIGVTNKHGNPLSQEVMTKLVKRPEYAGYVHDRFTNYELVEGKHEGLISKEVYWQNQDILKMNNKPYLLGLKHNDKNVKAPLSKFVKCVSCHKIMTRSNPEGKYRYYCARTTCRKTGSILTDELHDRFEALLVDIEPKPGTLRLMKEILSRTAVKELGNINQDIKDLRDRLDENANYRRKVMKQFINEKITEAEKNIETESCDEEKLALQQELHDLEQRQTLNESSIEYALNFMANVSKQWSDASLDLKHKIQTLIFPEGFEYDIQNEKFIIHKISPLYSGSSTIKRANSTENSVLVIPRRIELLLPG